VGALKKLFALASQVPGRQRISAAVTEGDVGSEILRYAELVKADLIVIGMHARDGGVSRLATRLAVDAPCPVVAVDETQTPRSANAVLRHILVAVNFLPGSLAAAHYGFALARPAGARVTVAHVVPERWEGPRRSDHNVDEMRRIVEQQFRQCLRIAIGEPSGASYGHSEFVTSGQPCVEIVRVVAARDVDLIVMGIDHDAVTPLQLGETIEYVMQFAQRSVVLVPGRLFRPDNRGDPRRLD